VCRAVRLKKEWAKCDEEELAEESGKETSELEKSP